MSTRAFHIGSVKFTSKKDCFDYVRNLLRRIPPDKKITDPTTDAFLRELVKRHPNAPFPNILYFGVFINTGDSRELRARLELGESLVISWNNCINGKVKSNDSKIKAAFRYAIHTQARRFRSGVTPVCVLCGSKETPQVDHYPLTFKTILNNFTQEPGVVIPTELDDHNLPYSPPLFKSSDQDLVKKWCDYHEAHAQYRILCQRCNIKTAHES